MKRPWPRIPVIVHAPVGAVRLLLLVLLLTLLAGIWTLLFGDIDAFEARTGLFDWIGRMIINAIVALAGLFCALWAVSLFFPARWGPKAGVIGAAVTALIAFLCFRVLWLGGV